jgi:hypothetical protein
MTISSNETWQRCSGRPCRKIIDISQIRRRRRSRWDRKITDIVRQEKRRCKRNNMWKEWRGVVGIATRYELNDPGIESRCRRIFRTYPDRPWSPHSLLYNGYRVSFPGVKRPGRGVNHPHPSSAEVKERVELYLCSPSGPSWPLLGRTLPLLIYIVSKGKRMKKSW